MIVRKEKIFLCGEHVGDLTRNDNETYTFKYLESHAQNGGDGISLTMDPQAQLEYQTYGVPQPVFENLLPEHESRQHLADSLGVAKDDYMSLLVGSTQDGQGAITVGEGASAQVPFRIDGFNTEDYHGEITNKCHGLYVDTETGFYSPHFCEDMSLVPSLFLPYPGTAFELVIDEANRKGTQLSGAQPKLSGSAVKSLSQGEYLQRHIIKFEVSGYRHISEVEHIIMRWAKVYGLEVAKSFLLRCSDGMLAYCVERFDRSDLGQRYKMEDFQQLLN